jgi:putative ubiquitin-RnfH superfamily antitoxin RatB of RatAB toxin-antitoxin module
MSKPLRITVAYSPCAGEVDEQRLDLPPGSTLADALRASTLYLRYPQAQGLPAGRWGKKLELEEPLRDQDRVEVYRPLRCDPKEARRLRYRQKSAKADAAKTEDGAPLSGNSQP